MLHYIPLWEHSPDEVAVSSQVHSWDVIQVASSFPEQSPEITGVSLLYDYVKEKKRNSIDS